jgi:uncharacterized protein YdhG (YjbR/CyaY superfamily)
VATVPEQFTSVEDYLDSLSPEVRSVLQEVRAALHSAVPGAEDTISYNIPTLTADGRRVVHYAGWTKHVSLYPAPGPTPDDADLEGEIAPYVVGKGTLKFPLDQPVPHDLVARVAKALSAAGRPAS